MALLAKLPTYTRTAAAAGEEERDYTYLRLARQAKRGGRSGGKKSSISEMLLAQKKS
jgi:hypothetical protein